MAATGPWSGPPALLLYCRAAARGGERERRGAADDRATTADELCECARFTTARKPDHSSSLPALLGCWLR
jgi:hypothetical protein